jgi:hypothetical protein
MTEVHTYFTEVFRITDQWSSWIYKQKKFSSITFNSASLSRRAIAPRWSPISHCLGSLGRINRHNLEKYLLYNHSFHWHSNAKTSEQYSKQHFKNNNSISGRRNSESSIFFLLFGDFPDFLLRNKTSSGTLSRCDNSEDNREDYRKRAYLVEKACWLRLANWTLGSWLCHRGYLVDFVNLHRRPVHVVQAWPIAARHWS